MIGETGEKGTYVRDRTKVRLRDHLKAERLRVTEDPYYSNDRGNARYRGKGCRAAQMVEYPCCTGGCMRQGKMN